MKNTMKKLATPRNAVVLCALLALALASPAYADKACSASLNLKTCVSSLDLNTITFAGGTLTASGVIKALNSGGSRGRILSVVANLQTKDKGAQFSTIAAVTAPCGTGLGLSKSLPLSVPGGAEVCGSGNEADIGFIATFSGLTLASGTPARLELQVTYDGATNGQAPDPCGATTVCGSRTLNVRFGFVVP